MSEYDSVSVSAVDLSPTANVSVIYYDAMQQTWLRVVLISLYVIIFVLGVAGNSLVVYIVAARRAMQSITNIFIANLAVSDVIMCLLAVPFTPISGLLQSWPFGEALCHLVPMTMGVSVHVSTLTSTAIAVDRYFVIVHPFTPSQTAIQIFKDRHSDRHSDLHRPSFGPHHSDRHRPPFRPS